MVIDDDKEIEQLYNDPKSGTAKKFMKRVFDERLKELKEEEKKNKKEETFLDWLFK